MKFREPEPEWMAEAACRGVDAVLFYPSRGESTAQAKRVCRRCPHIEACLEYAMEHRETFGIWGATSERERRRMRRGQRVELAEAG